VAPETSYDRRVGPVPALLANRDLRCPFRLVR
jgi:hypothetical protein